MSKYLRREKWTILSIVMTLLCVFLGGGFMMAEASVTVTTGGAEASPGQAGLSTQLPGQAVTVSAARQAGGEGTEESLIQADIDEDIFLIGTDETVLDGIMRKAKRKKLCTGFEVDHYVIDERKAYATTSEEYTGSGREQDPINVGAADQKLFSVCDTVIVKGVNGYTDDGQTPIPGSDLMLYVVGKDSSGNPIVRAVNGPKTSPSVDFCTIPSIPSGTKMIFLAVAGAETQKWVSPNMVIPTPQRVYLQKMIMNQIVSDYFNAQKKRIPFAESTIAEAIVSEFRKKCNRTLWIGQKSKFKVDRGEMGVQYVYTTQGIRWQIKRQYDHTGPWTFEEIIALAKMKFTGQNCSKKAFWLMGKNQLEGIQNIDFTKHKDITMTNATVWGFEVTQLHTVFGDFHLKHEPTLDYIDYENSGAILDEEGIVRYYMKNEETSTDDVEGEEAKRKCIISTNALALKGTSHIWVNGEDGASDLPGGVVIKPWSKASSAPESPALNSVYLLTVDCTAISGSKAGELYQWNGSSWVKYSGTIYVKSA